MMKEITNRQEIEQIKEKILDMRTKNQREKDDYDRNEDGQIEYCRCGRALNSHGWCYFCDG